MKNTIVLSAFVAALSAFSAYSHSHKVGMNAKPPKYLQIPGFKDCLNSEPRGSAIFYCMPAQKPVQCQEESWEALQNLSDKQRVADCMNQ